MNKYLELHLYLSIRVGVLVAGKGHLSVTYALRVLALLGAAGLGRPQELFSVLTCPQYCPHSEIYAFRVILLELCCER